MRRTGLTRTIWVLGTICLVVALAWAGDRDRGGPRGQGREASEARAPQTERSWSRAEKAAPQPSGSHGQDPAATAPSWHPREDRPVSASRADTWRERGDWAPTFRPQADRAGGTPREADTGWTPGRSLRFETGVERMSGRTPRDEGRSESAPVRVWQPGETTPRERATPGGGSDEDWTPGRSLRFGRDEEPGGEKPSVGPQREQRRTESAFGQRTEPTPGQREEPGEGARWQKGEPGRSSDEDLTPGRSLRFGRDEEPGGEKAGPGPQREQHRTESALGKRTEPAPGQRDEPGERALGPKSEPGRGSDEDWTPGRSLRWTPGADRPGGEKSGGERPRAEAFRPEGRDADAGRTSRPEKFPGGRPGATRDEEAIRKLAGTPPRPGDPPRLFVNGSELRFPQPPKLHDGHPVAPVKPFVEKIGGRMWFDHKTGYWHVHHRDHVIRFRIGDRRAYCGDRLIILIVAPYVIGGYIYCPIEPFAFFFGVRYHWHYYWEPPVWYYPYISQRRAIAIARDYLIDLDEYPYRVLYVEAYRKRAPANHFWEAVTSGYEPLWDAPRRLCWVVEFGYRRGHRDAWKQVFVDAHTGRVVGGWHSEYDYYADDWY